MRIKRVMGGWALIGDSQDGEGAPIRVLRIGGVFQSATYMGERRFELPFEYFRAFNRMFEAEGLDIRRVLVIGAGACTYPKHLAHAHPEVKVDAVERDPAIVRIARKHFYAGEMEGEGRLSIIVGDGIGFLEKSAKRVSEGLPPYDAVIDDAFNGADPVADLLEPDVLDLVKASLSQDGLYMVNVVCSDSKEGAVHLQEVLEALKMRFKHVCAIPAIDAAISDSDNYIAVASDTGYVFEGAFAL